MNWTAIGLTVLVGAVAGSAFVYATQNTFDWPKTFSAANDAAQIVALVIGGSWALDRFVATRASRTFLEMSVSAKVVGGTDDNVLVQVVVRLKNVGTSRIDARQGAQPGAFLYDDAWDRCRHAGTLKIRAVPDGDAPAVFDWYGLPAVPATLTLAASHKTPADIAPTAGDLEQINYLADFQDPEGGYTDADFWLEPGEVYEPMVSVRLPRGNYAVKAYFLGDEERHGEEEYWSHTMLCRLEVPPSKAVLSVGEPLDASGNPAVGADR